jgi:23S rRNA (cytidine2498-2'-O)-methyltransferase
MNGIVLYCRAGFEAECAAEAADLLRLDALGGFARATPGAGLLTVEIHDAAGARRVHETVPWSDWIFPRQWFVQTAALADLPVADRATPIAQAIAAAGQPVAGVFLETPDRDDTKVLAPLCRALERPVAGQLQRAGAWAERSAWRAHVCFTASTGALIGIARVDNSAPWPGGVPRLKFPRAAPSRSTLKLEEAFLTFLNARDRESLLRPGLRAVDLGAAPGGWSWQFVHRHIHVTAVDNGAMDPQLMDSGLVQHVHADGFRYRPDKPVDWLVCDIVEQPIRVARLAGQWFAQGWCRRAIFNLKLPMKKRYAEVRRCLGETESIVAQAGRRVRLHCRQLYHDREEVTVYLEPA